MVLPDPQYRHSAVDALLLSTAQHAFPVLTCKAMHTSPGHILHTIQKEKRWHLLNVCRSNPLYQRHSIIPRGNAFRDIYRTL